MAGSRGRRREMAGHANASTSEQGCCQGKPDWSNGKRGMRLGETLKMTALALALARLLLD